MIAPGIELLKLPADAHRCTGETVGDWVVFRCPICEGYERRINWRTGKMVVRGRSDFDHYGSPNGLSNAVALLQTANPN